MGVWGVVLVVCVRVVFSVGVCVCDLLIHLHREYIEPHLLV